MQNPAIILLIAVLLVARFVGRAIAAGKKKAAAKASPPATDAERTRRVREEVARKIAERRRESIPPAVARQQAEAPPDPPPPRATAAEADLAGVLAQQQSLVDRMRALEQAPSASPARGAAFPSASAPVDLAPGAWPRELGDPHGARRAIVQREVLGPPRGLTLEGCLWR